VLSKLSAEITECHRHAEDCAREAAAQRDPKLREDFLTLERRWLKLAASYELAERIETFSIENKRLSK
jgi:hypothetical protein